MTDYKPFIEVEAFFYEKVSEDEEILEEIGVETERQERIFKITINKDFVSDFYPDGDEDKHTTVVIGGGKRILVNLKYEEFKQFFSGEYHNITLNRFRDRDLP